MESQKHFEQDFDNRLENDIEALLFASNTPLSIGRLSSITGVTSGKTIKEAINSLVEFYRENGRAFQILEVAGGYQISTLPEYSGMIAKLFKSRRKTKLSQAALETLAIIAYKQPINRINIEAIRGVNCDGVLTTLTERELVAITGRGEGVGRPYLYSTTSRFLEYLGLKDYRELPDMEELERNLEMLELIPQPVDKKPSEEEGVVPAEAREEESSSRPEGNPGSPMNGDILPLEDDLQGSGSE